MFHNILREIREKRGFSQKELADMLGLPVTTYRNYENTQREPSYDILIRIADILCVSVDELLGVRYPDSAYLNFFPKVKKLSSRQFNMVSEFVDFLLMRSSSK